MNDRSPAADNAFGARAHLTTGQGTTYSYYRLGRLVELGLLDSIDRLPFTVRILLEVDPATGKLDESTKND